MAIIKPDAVAHGKADEIIMKVRNIYLLMLMILLKLFGEYVRNVNKTYYKIIVFISDTRGWV